MTQTRSSKATTAGDKHKLEDRPSSPPSKAQKKEEKKQLTLDETLNGLVLGATKLKHHTNLPRSLKTDSSQ